MDAFSPPASSTSSSLVYLKDLLSSCWFLVDSSASILVLHAVASTYNSGVKLLTADGSSLACSCSWIIPLHFGAFNFDWPFQLAPVSVPILGVDFIPHRNLLLDVANQKVFCSSPGQPSLILTSSPMPSLPSAALLFPPKYVSDLLSKFSDVLSSVGFPASPPIHQVCHHLVTQPGPPMFAKPCRLDPNKLASAKAEFPTMEKVGIIQHSTSPWSSPLHMVKKKDRGWRPCGDYRRLNTILFLITTLFPTSPTSPLESLDQQFSPNSTSRKVITRFWWPQKTSRRLPSSPPLGCTSF